MNPAPSGITGAMIGTFRVVEKLGEGAMGRVYRAEDTRLGRPVALKLLSRELAGDAGRRQRFQGEARLLASLNHPGIVTIYSVEEALLPEPVTEEDDGDTLRAIRRQCCDSDGRVFFFTMELVDGVSLDRVIPESGVEPERFFDLGIALAEALATAHEKGVTHRDLKPANVMVTGEGAVKVLDFGLARSGGVAPGEQRLLETEELDEDGLLVGTIPYMAPEQINGMAVDQRTDVFALGIVLFEMAAGVRPFEGRSSVEQISAILRDAPRALAEIRPDYAPEVGRLIERCLAKEPKLRPQTARDVRNLLEEARLSSDPSSVRAVAVLAFSDISPEKDQDYFCEGLAEELINALGRVEGLRVASRTSSFQFPRRGLDVRELGRRLNVDAVLEGSVRKAGERLRITAELVAVADGFALWSGRFDRRLEDVFAIQEEIAQSIVRALEVTLSADEKKRMGRGSTRVLDAYDLYLRGLKYYYQYSRHGMEFALDLFHRAIALDPDFARAHAGIANCHSYLYANAERTPEHLDRALAAAGRALELDPEAAESHLARATALAAAERMGEAGGCFETALRCNPRLFEAHYFYARHLFVVGSAHQAIHHYRRAGELRPDDYQGPLLSAQIHDDLGDRQEAERIRRHGVQLAEERLRLRPDDTRALYMASNALVTLGEKERGLAWARRARELDPEEPMLLYNLGCIYSLAGEVEEALECLESCLDRGFAFRGWLEQDSNLDAVRGEPRYQKLLERL